MRSTSLVALFACVSALLCVGDRVLPRWHDVKTVVRLSSPPGPRFVRWLDVRPLTAIEARLKTAQLERQVYVDGDTSAETAWQLGRARLASGAPDAIRALESAVTAAPEQAQFAADLGAARLVSPGVETTAYDLVRSLDASARAARLDSNRVEALFNAAFALDQLGWRTLAHAMWQSYLTRDSTSTWAAYARQRLSDLMHSSLRPPTSYRPQLVAARSKDLATLDRVGRESPEAARLFVEEVLLPEFASDVQRGAARCAAFIDMTRTLGTAVATVSGDRMLTDLALDLKDICESEASIRLEAAAAIDALEIGSRQTNRGEMESAAETLALAAASFSRSRALRRVCAMWQSVSAFTLEAPESLVSKVNAAIDDADAYQYIYLSGRFRVVAGSTALRLALRSVALDRYREATEAFDRGRETEYVASTAVLVGQSLKEQGSYDEAWPWVSRAIRLLDGMDSPRRQFFVLYNAALTANDENLNDVARLVQPALEDLSVKWGEPSGLTLAQLLVADNLSALGDSLGARLAIERAKRQLGQIADAAYRDQLGGQIALAEGAAEQWDAPNAAFEALSSSLAIFSGRGFSHHLARTYLLRGRVNARLGRLEQAENDWREGIRVFEDQRPEIRAEQLRISQMSQLWGLFSEMIQLLAIDGSRGVEALQYIERSRARALLDSLSAGQRQLPGDPIKLVKELPQDVNVVVYAAVDNGLFVSVLGKSSVNFGQSPISRDRLSALVDRWRFQITHGIRDDETASRLYELLITPIRRHLAVGRPVVVVPEGPLEFLPFAALLDQSTGRRLMMDFPVGLAPSVTALALASRPADDLVADLNVLAVGDAQEAAARWKGLPQLPDAEREAVEVAKLYPTSVLLTGHAATRERFLAEIKDAVIVHFAGHAIADPRFPARSYLLLAAETGTAPSRVFPADIASLPLKRTKLAVLSACETAFGPAGRGEGVMSLARPFLAAGVSQVVASLWEVSDRSARSLLTDFHRRVRSGDNVLVALQRAQQDQFARGGEMQQTREWAAFTGIGGIRSLGQQETP